MGKAREVMDRLTEVLFQQRDVGAAVEMYDDNAIMMTPDAGDIQGRAAIADYWRQFIDSFPDARYEPIGRYESDGVAIDEGMLVGTNTAPLRLGTGETMPATGRDIGVRSCDIVMLADGRISEHHVYFDQLEFLDQLGLMASVESEETEELEEPQ